jgi:AcrR family transcriptional regulator
MRKTPQQARSRQMVDRLIDATATCIAQRGLADTTTPAIAETAGVSVGSLYQYFSSREEMVDALVERLAGHLARALGKLAGAGAPGDVRQLIRQSISTGFALLHANEGLYLELIRHWHSLPMHKVADVLQQHFLTYSQVFFLKHHREWPIENLHVKLYIIINSTLFTMVRYLSQPPPLVSEEQLIDELATMITDYLLPGPAA